MLQNKLLSGILTGAIFLLALALRAWGADYGLPRDYVPDEQTKMTAILSLEEKYFQHWESQPSFMYYSIYAIQSALSPFQSAIMAACPERFNGPEAGIAYLKWISRLYMGFLGALTCVVIHRLGKFVAGKGTGLIAAFLYAVTPLPIALSHYVKEDTPLVLFMTLNMLCCLRLLRKGRTVDYFFAGVTAGLAFASKYPGVFTLALVAGAICLRERDRFRVFPTLWERVRHVLWLMRLPLAMFAFTFFVVCPTYLDFFRLAWGLFFQAEYMVHGHHDGISVTAWAHLFTFYVRKSLIPGLSLGVFLIALPGIYFLWKRGRQLAIIPIAWGLGYLLLAELLPSKPYPFYSRYIIPVVPMFCLYAAAALTSLPEWGRRWMPARVLLPAAWIGGTAIIACPLALSLIFLSHTKPDTRDEASAWVNSNLPPGALIFSTTPRYTGYFDPERFQVEELKRSGNDNRRWFHRNRDSYAVVSSLAVDRFLENKGSRRRDYDFWKKNIMVKENLLAEFLPAGPTHGFHNPEVRVYRLPRPTKPPKDAVVIEESEDPSRD